MGLGFTKFTAEKVDSQTKVTSNILFSKNKSSIIF